MHIQNSVKYSKYGQSDEIFYWLRSFLYTMSKLQSQICSNLEVIKNIYQNDAYLKALSYFTFS